MATKPEFLGKQYTQPGLYVERAAGQASQSQISTYGNVLLIDSGKGAGFGGGSGVNGVLEKNRKSVREFKTIQDFQAFIGGGRFYEIAETMFTPLNGSVEGVQSLFYAKLAQTYPAYKSLVFKGTVGGSGAAASCDLKAVTANIVDGGTGYLVGDTITLAGGTFTTATVLTVTSVSSGVITGVSITTVGSYTVIPSDWTTVLQGSTSGAGTDATFTITYGIGTITVISGGSGYTSVPKVLINGGGYGAVVNATIALGAVTGFTVVDSGTYFALPSLSTVANYSGTGGASTSTSYLGSTDININVPALPLNSIVTNIEIKISYTSNPNSYRKELRVRVTPPLAATQTDIQPSTDSSAGSVTNAQLGIWDTTNPTGVWNFAFRETFDDATPIDANITNITITVEYLQSDIAIIPTESGANGGFVTIAPKAEGIAGNGSLVSNVLTRGFGMSMAVGVTNPSKYVTTFSRGTFTGLDEQGFPYNGVLESNSRPNTLCRTSEISTIDEFITFANTNSRFKDNFVLVETYKVGNGSFGSSALTTNSGTILFNGGAEYYNSESVDTFVANANKIDFSFMVSDRNNTEYGGYVNSKLASYVQAKTSKRRFTLFIGGGSGASDYDTVSIAAAELFGLEGVAVIQGDIKIAKPQRGNVDRDSHYNACYATAIAAGLFVTIPLTNKQAPIADLKEELNDTQIDECIDAGVVVVDYRSNAFRYVWGINSLQNQDQTINPETGESFEMSVRRINDFLQAELQRQGELAGFAGGSNRGVASVNNFRSFLDDFFKSFLITDLNPNNLLLAYKILSVTASGDALYAVVSINENRPMNFSFIKTISELDIN